MHNEVQGYGKPGWGSEQMSDNVNRAWKNVFFCKQDPTIKYSKEILKSVVIPDDTPPRYVRIQSDDWLMISQVTAKAADGTNLSMGKPCTSSGPYLGREANKCDVALDGNQAMRFYTDNIGNVGSTHGNFHSKAQADSFWQVDLGEDGAGLDSITIHNRKAANTREF